MRSEPFVSFLKKNAPELIGAFVAEAHAQRREGLYWRCLYALLDPRLAKDPARKSIASNFLTSLMENNADDVRAFWLTSGHLFVFFRGPVRAVIRDYELFLGAVCEGEKPEYLFFWELQDFHGYFDRVLAATLDEGGEAARSRAVPERPDGPLIAPDLSRARQVRYKPLLLIVEDDRVTRHTLQGFMTKYCDIAVAWNAQQARAFYREMAPNIVFLDIELPDGDGRELAARFCANDPDSFVVMVSGGLSDKVVLQCMESGVKGCIAKPAEEKRLAEFITQYHALRRHKGAAG